MTSNPNKMKACGAISQQTVDHLYTLLDFNKFKKQMLEVKKGANAPVPVHQPDINLGEEMPAYTYEEFQQVYNEDRESKNAPWKLKLKQDFFKDHYKVRVY